MRQTTAGLLALTIMASANSAYAFWPLSDLEPEIIVRYDPVACTEVAKFYVVVRNPTDETLLNFHSDIEISKPGIDGVWTKITFRARDLVSPGASIAYCIDIGRDDAARLVERQHPNMGSFDLYLMYPRQDGGYGTDDRTFFANAQFEVTVSFFDYGPAN